jgi:hypothetical protein
MAFLLPLNLRSFIDSAHSTQMVCFGWGVLYARVPCYRGDRYVVARRFKPSLLLIARTRLRV